VWCFGLFWALTLICFPGYSRVGAVQRLCRPEFLTCNFVCRAMPSREQDSFFSFVTSIEFFHHQWLLVAISSSSGCTARTASPSLARVPSVGRSDSRAPLELAWICCAAHRARRFSSHFAGTGSQRLFRFLAAASKIFVCHSI
jgi:hypothetical protein